MPYRVEYLEDSGIVRLTLTGKASTAEDHLAARESVIDECETYGSQKVLVCMEEQKTMMTSDSQALYEFGSSFSKERIPPTVKIAVVRCKENVDAGLIGAAARASGVNLREFCSLDDALHWLKQ